MEEKDYKKRIKELLRMFCAAAGNTAVCVQHINIRHAEI